jgi:suppressor of ftsI
MECKEPARLRGDRCRAALLIASLIFAVAAIAQENLLVEPATAHSPVALDAVHNAESDRMAFSFAGQNVAPTIRVSQGQTLRLDYTNHLPKTSDEQCVVVPCTDMTNLHFHGLHVSPNEPQDDVLTMLAMPGETLHYKVPILAGVAPGLYWYHTHPHGESYRQSLDGMSGALVVEGMERYVPEVGRIPERILVLRSEELKSQAPGTAATLAKVLVGTEKCGSENEAPERVFTVNGQLRPGIPIAEGERQFWRIVNASPDLYADLQVDGEKVEIVALDGMPLALHNPKQPTRLEEHVLVPPAGRLEAIVTGPPKGSHAALRTRCINTGPDGDPNREMVIADIVPGTKTNVKASATVSGRGEAKTIPPAKLAQLEKAEPDFTVIFTEDKAGFYINGAKFAMDSAPMITVKIGGYQHWRVLNRTAELHPFHIHQVHFLAYEENGKALPNADWLDTVNVPYGGSVDLVMDFTDPVIRGMSVFHCHLLKHEDKGMMAKILFK